MDMPTEPPVAWKKEPWGRESMTVAPAWVIAAAERAGMPAPSRVEANVWEAMVVPAVVEAVAPAIRMPAMGASTKAGIFIASSRLITLACREDAWMTPDRVPVPINRTATPMTLLRPNPA